MGSIGLLLFFTVLTQKISFFAVVLFISDLTQFAERSLCDESSGVLGV